MASGTLNQGIEKLDLLAVKLVLNLTLTYNCKAYKPELLCMVLKKGPIYFRSQFSNNIFRVERSLSETLQPSNYIFDSINGYSYTVPLLSLCGSC